MVLAYTGDPIERIELGKNSPKFYSSIPRPLMRVHMYQMDGELAVLLIDAHGNIGFMEGLIKYAPNKDVFTELMLLKECSYSRMIDYDSSDFEEVLTSRGTGKGNIAPIMNLEAAYSAVTNMEIERYNGTVGRSLVAMMLSDIVGEARLLICLSEHLYHNENECFDLLWATQYSNGHIRWIKIFVNAVGRAAKQFAEQLAQYEQHVIEDLEHLLDIKTPSKSVFSLYEYLKRCP